MGQMEPNTASPWRRQAVCLYILGLQLLVVTARGQSVLSHPRRASHHSTAAAAPDILVGPAPSPAKTSHLGFQHSPSGSFDGEALQLEEESNAIKASDDVTHLGRRQVEVPVSARSPATASVLGPSTSVAAGTLLLTSNARAEAGSDSPTQVTNSAYNGFLAANSSDAASNGITGIGAALVNGLLRAQSPLIFDLQNGAARSANSIVNTVAGVQSAVLTSAGNLANSTGSAVLPLAGTDDVMSQLSETVSRALAGLGNNSPSLVSQSSRFAPSVSSAPTPSQAIVTIPGTDFKSGYAFSG